MGKNVLFLFQVSSLRSRFMKLENAGKERMSGAREWRKYVACEYSRLSFTSRNEERNGKRDVCDSPPKIPY